MSSLTRCSRELNAGTWSAPDSRATVRRLRPMCTITSVLCLSRGLVREMRKRNNSRTQGRPYGTGGLVPSKIKVLFSRRKEYNISYNDFSYQREEIYYR